MIEFGIEAKNKIKKGVDSLADAVKVTLGPRGRNVIIRQPPISPHITKDGVTVARAINLHDEIENVGAQLLKDVAGKTCSDVGDGTTTSIVLAQAIYAEGLKHISSGINVSLLKSGIDKTVKDVLIYLDTAKTDINPNNKELLKYIALVSSNQDEELSEILSDTFSKIGLDGVITIEDSKIPETYIEVVEGLQLDKGFVNPYFGNNEKEECILENCKILVVDGKINTEREIISILEACALSGNSLLIVCDQIDPKPLSVVLNNTLKHTIKACVVYSPGFGQMRKHKTEDLLSVVGGSMWKSNNEDFDTGYADKVIVDANKTVIIGGKGDPDILIKRIRTIRNLVESSTGLESQYTIEKLQERLATLVNGIGILYIGAQSDVELKEKKDRADDSIRAIQAALQEGIVVGGGSEYIKAISFLNEQDISDYTNDELLGREIIIKALQAPITQICINASKNPEKIIYLLDLCHSKDYGYNVTTDSIEYMYDSGIIDPKKVLRVCLENAASVGAALLTTECVIIKEDKIPLIN